MRKSLSAPIVFWNEQENSYGLPAYVLKRMVHPNEREKLEKWSQLHARKRDPRGKKIWSCFESKDTGCRLGPEGNKKKPSRPHSKPRKIKCGRGASERWKQAWS